MIMSEPNLELDPDDTTSRLWFLEPVSRDHIALFGQGILCGISIAFLISCVLIYQDATAFPHTTEPTTYTQVELLKLIGSSVGVALLPVAFSIIVINVGDEG